MPGSKPVFHAGRLDKIREAVAFMRANYLDLYEEELTLLGMVEEVLHENDRLAAPA